MTKDDLKLAICDAVSDYNAAQHPNGLSGYVQSKLGTDASKLLFTDRDLFLLTAQQITIHQTNNIELYKLHTNLYALCSDAWLYQAYDLTYDIPNIFNESVASLYMFLLNNINIEIEHKLSCVYQLIRNELGQGQPSTHAFVQAFSFLQEYKMIEPWLDADRDSNDYTDAYYECFNELYTPQLINTGLALNLTPSEFIEYAKNHACVDVHAHPLDFNL